VNHFNTFYGNFNGHPIKILCEQQVTSTTKYQYIPLAEVENLAKQLKLFEGVYFNKFFGFGIDSKCVVRLQRYVLQDVQFVQASKTILQNMQTHF
jgi:hypothetical protein